MPARRFPPPWSVEEQKAYYVVRDHNGQQHAYTSISRVRQDVAILTCAVLVGFVCH
jgi:hypothetical protein